VENFKVLWIDSNGHAHVSAVSYDKASADRRADELRADMSDVSVVPVFPPNWGVEVEQPKSKGRVVQHRHTVRK
jgi:hypothetical protein